MPPPGGFAPIKYKRSLPFRGPSGAVVLAGVAAVCAYGFYKAGQGNLERSLGIGAAATGRAAPDYRVWDAVARLSWGAANQEEAGNEINVAQSVELRRESAWARIHLVPLLLAEGDRDTYRREQAAQAREREIMKDVRGAGGVRGRSRAG
ncbi:hypothetical protein FRC10_009921 [Ceratobasidium sp. 414]|nr:hypothetical protein FRC10_009921 [Ceratobasidium sp. 414]